MNITVHTSELEAVLNNSSAFSQKLKLYKNSSLF